MILLKRITLTNFLSHENTTIDFSENEKALIDGASGAGKSSIFDAIIWSLYGVSRADNRSLVRKGAKMGSVTLTLDNNGETIIITRRTTSSGKHVLELLTEQPDGKRIAYPLSGVRELQNHIEKNIIGASYLLFINSVAYVQGNTESFVAQTAPKRKELLLEIVKAEDYSDYYSKARELLQALQSDEGNVVGQITILESQAAILAHNIGNKHDLINRIELNTAKLPAINKKKAEVDSRRKDAQTMRTMAAAMGVSPSLAYERELKECIEIKDQLERNLERKLLRIKNVKEKGTGSRTKEELLLDIEQVKIEINENSKRAEVYLKAKQSEPWTLRYSSEIGILIKRIQLHESKPVCPSNDQCPYYSIDLTQLAEDTKRWVELQGLTRKEEESHGLWEQKMTETPEPASPYKLQDKLTRLNGIINGIDSLVEYENDAKELEERIEDTKKSIKALRDQVKRAEEAYSEEGMRNLDRDIAEVEAEERFVSAEVTRATTMLENIDRDEKTLKDTEGKIETLKLRELVDIQCKTRKISLVKEAFGPKGIETLVIDYLLPKLEDKINEVLSKLSDFRVRIDTQKKKADGDSVTEGLFITILNEVNEEMPFESYSGGEKLKISVAISEALATLQKVGFRLFDETFLSLDENSTESFSRVLQDLQKNFSQVLCISHLLQIKELFDKKLNIIKNKNISYVK